MKKIFLAAVVAFCSSSVGFAQHSDIEFGFESDGMGGLDTSIVEIEADERNVDGYAILEGEFEDLDFTGSNPNLFSDNPGFITPIEEGLSVNVGDAVSLRFLNAGTDSSVGAGFVNFFDPDNAGAGIQNFGSLRITSSSDNSVFIDLDDNTASEQSIFLAFGDDGTGQSNPPGGEAPEDLEPGQIHTHLQFDLQDESSTPAGALGLLAQFEVDFANGTAGPDGNIDVTSDPFFLIFNAGLDDAVFEDQAVPAFGLVAVPEPASGALLMGAAGAVLVRRRKRLF